MGTHHSLFLYCVFIWNFISPLYCDDVYSYLRPPDRPAVSVNRTRTRIFINRCSRIPIPNGSMVLKHRGRVAKFTCSPGYKLIGDNIATCHQRKWDAVPTCVKDVQCPEEIPKVINGRMIEYSYVYFKVICNDGYKLPNNVQSIYPCEEFFRPDVMPPVCQLSDALYCDFERDTCGWNNTIPYFSWIRYQNATPSHELRTGPGGDHTTGAGHYLYIEASGLPDHEERYAKLTRFFKQVDSPEVCFVFWYHMYGFSIGTLDVYVDINKVFSKSGNLGDKWRKGIVQRLPSDRDFYISVMATTANGFAGDIAIDDIGLVNSTECTKTILIDTTCKNRCFEGEVNPKLCKCSSECLIEGTCCTDFMHFCSNDAITSTATAGTTDWEATTEEWQVSSNEVQTSVFGDYQASGSVVNGSGSTDMYDGSTSQYASSTFEDQDTEVSDSDGGQGNTEGGVTDQDYLTASESTRDSDSTPLVGYNDLSWYNDWRSSTQQQTLDASKKSSAQSELHDVGRSLPPPQQESYYVREPWASTHQEPLDVSKKLMSVQPERYDTGNGWTSTEREPLDESKGWSSTEQEHHDNVNNSMTSASNKPTQVTTSAKYPVPSSEPNSLGPDLPGVSVKTSKNALSKDKGQSLSTSTIKIESTSEKPPRTTPIYAPTVPNVIVIHVESTNSSPLLPTSQPPVTTTLTTKPQQKSTAAPSTAPAINHANDPSSTASHTHLHPENDYDEIDESTQAVTHGPHRQTRLDLETTPSVESASPQKTRKPYKWKKTYEPKDRAEALPTPEVKTEEVLCLTPGPNPMSAWETGSPAEQAPTSRASESISLGRYTFSAVKSENKTTTYVSVLFGVTAFLAAVVAAAYIFQRRRAIRFRDATEESDVLYMTSDDILDFNVARRPTPPARGAPSHPGQPNSGPTSSQQSTRVCQSDFSFCSSNKC